MPISLLAEVELLKQYRNFPVNNGTMPHDSEQTFIRGKHAMNLVILFWQILLLDMSNDASLLADMSNSKICLVLANFVPFQNDQE